MGFIKVEKKLISLVAGVPAWGVSKFLVGEFLGVMVGGVVGWILYKRLKEKERKRLHDLDHGDGDSSGEPCRGDGDVDKMMKAPGRDYLMPRKDFQANPSDYFRRLRGK